MPHRVKTAEAQGLCSSFGVGGRTQSTETAAVPGSSMGVGGSKPTTISPGTMGKVQTRTPTIVYCSVSG